MAFTVTVTPFQLSPTETWTTAKFNQGFNPTVAATGNLADLSNWNTVSAVTKTFTVTDLATDVITATAHGLTTGQRVTVFSTTTLPAGLSSTANYYARALTADTLSLHYTAAGASAATNRVDITTNGTGTHSLTYTVYATGQPLIFNAGTSKWEYGIVSAGNIPEFVGSTASAPGVRGAVPQPAPSDRDKYLRGDGAWANPTETLSTGNNLFFYSNLI